MRENNKRALAAYMQQEQKLSKEIIRNRKIINNNSDMNRLSFKEMINSAELRHDEKEKVQHIKSKEATFGKSIGTVGLERKLMAEKGISNIIDLKDTIRYDREMISWLERDISLTTDILNTEEQTRQAVIQYEATLFAVRTFEKAESREEKKKIGSRYYQELEQNNKAKEFLENKGLITDKDILKYKQKYNRVLNDRYLNRLRLNDLKKELEELQKVEKLQRSVDISVSRRIR